MRPPTIRLTWSVLTLVVGLAAVAVPVSSALASEPRVFVAQSSPVPTYDVVVNQTITTTFDVILRQPDPGALSAFISSLSTPVSPNYHHYLTTTQFATRFGASSASIDAVTSYLQGYGLKVGALSKGHIVLHVSGSTSDVARAFGAPVATVRTSTGALAAQFTAKATLPAPVAHDVVAVTGLSSVVAPQSPSLRPSAVSHVTIPSACPSAGSSSSPTPNSLGGYTVQQIAQLYGLSTAWSSGDTGVGQTIGVYELGNFSPSDLATYFSCYGLNPSLTNQNVDSGSPGGYSDEATLDVEEAAAMAPGAAIQVYTGPNTGNGPTDVYQQMADNNTASIITTSWGDCEVDPSSSASSEQPIFEQMAAQGQTVVSASGDFGSSDCSGITTKSPAVDDPSSQPYVTGVGGLNVSSTGPLTQSVWNDGLNSNGGATGGGVSQLWSRPAWQNAPGIAATATMRMVPDLSVIGDPATGFIQYYTGSGSGFCHQSCSGGWSSIGGTSIGAPLVSALVATAAQTCGVARLGFINPSLYAMASTGFIDVTAGNNDLFGVGAYSAGVGYDMASGLGSPNPATFIAGLCPAPVDPTRSSLLATTASQVINTTATATLTVRNTNNGPVPNAQVNITAAAAAGGSVVLDGDHASITGSGTASYVVTTNASGVATIDVLATSPGPVALSAVFGAQTLATATVNFTMPSTQTARPGAPRITNIVALVGGFRLRVTPPTSSGQRAITAFQYSINAGATWSSFSVKTRVVTTAKLARGKTYKVIVRALNPNGPGARSAPMSVTTRL